VFVSRRCGWFARARAKTRHRFEPRHSRYVPPLQARRNRFQDLFRRCARLPRSPHVRFRGKRVTVLCFWLDAALDLERLPRIHYKPVLGCSSEKLALIYKHNRDQISPCLRPRAAAFSRISCNPPDCTAVRPSATLAETFWLYAKPSSSRMGPWIDQRRREVRGRLYAVALSGVSSQTARTNGRQYSHQFSGYATAITAFAAIFSTGFA